ncbi:MAG TPA: dTMP kinase [Candidatus Dormibacteraeota bacterium]|nr:dTMP kinase [Candidatus Dormibacteraeota bacterium]
MRGRFITLEGPEGAGKTVIAKRLVAELERGGREVVSTREPGGTRLGERIRSILLSRAGDEGEPPIDPRADALLFNAARAQLVSEVIRPALERGAIVLCARFTDSTLAYQGYGAGLPIEELRALAALAIGGLDPDLTVLLDVPPAIGLGRKTGASRNRFEAFFDLAFHERVRAGFLALAGAEPARFRVVDSARPIDVVAAEVIAVVLALVWREPPRARPGSAPGP